MSEERADVLVVGGGPAGCAAATHLAEAGHDVIVLEKARHPREKTCGDGLTPRSVKALLDLGMDSELAAYHRVKGLRACGHGRTLELLWPDHSVFPQYGLTVRRRSLDHDIAKRAESAGAAIWEETEAVTPVFERGLLKGAIARRKREAGEVTVRARIVVLADGALSRFSRQLGPARDKTYPMGLAVRTYYASPYDTDEWMESHLDLFKNGKALPAYGWVFPMADGSVNVGAGLLTTFGGWKEVNTTDLLDAFVDLAGTTWGFGPSEMLQPPMGGKLQMALCVKPRSGPNWFITGDASGAINPFNGEGIAYALETAEIAAAVADRMLRSAPGAIAADYDRALYERYGPYYRCGRIFAKAIGDPRIMRLLASYGMRSKPLMQWVLMVLANLLDPAGRDLTTRAYVLLEQAMKAGSIGRD